MAPFLSICIPTFNRADRLRVSLQAVVPQVAEHLDEVELWISDNASQDETPVVVEEAKALGDFNYSRNQSNIGLVSNVIKATTELARGEFVWVLGDDDLLRPDAVTRVLEALKRNRERDLIYVNFRYATYPQDWPANAIGGYEGRFEGLANPETSDRQLSHWHEVVRAHSSMCGQLYVHVMRRQIWQEYWRDRPKRPDFSDTRWSFPHSYMIAETVMNNPSYYVGDPVLTIFNGAQSWWQERHAVTFRFPGLLLPYKAHGLPQSQFDECERMAFSYCEPLLVEVLRGEASPEAPGLMTFIRENWRFKEAWRTLWRASQAAGHPRPLVGIISVLRRIRYVSSAARNQFRAARRKIL